MSIVLGWRYLPANERTFSSNGAASTVARAGVGDYTVTLPGLGTARSHPQVSSFGDVSRFCTIAAWRQVGSDEQIDVSCFQVGGAPVDARFTLSFLQ